MLQTKLAHLEAKIDHLLLLYIQSGQARLSKDLVPGCFSYITYTCSRDFKPVLAWTFRLISAAHAVLILAATRWQSLWVLESS